MAHTILKKGIDVSSIQKNIDWKKVREAGYEFAMIRVAFRGYGLAGSLQPDKYYKQNLEGAIAQGMQVGCYVYSQAKNDDEVIAEANLVLLLIAPYRANITLPVVFDYEGYNNPKQRVYGSTKAQRTHFCQLFNNMIQNAGYKSMLYGSQGNIRTTYDLNVLQYPIWCAKYPNTKIPNDNDKYFPNLKKDEYNERIAIWQYASCGFVPGISVRVDMNNMYKDLSADYPDNKESCNPYAEPTGIVRYSALKSWTPREDVKWVQWELVEDGYQLEIDGKFGKLTLAAVKDYQAKHGLVVDGIVGPKTKESMKTV